ncbi:18S rRNA (adenine1779-N6/adenine1780-N6)-dimethyltransferase, partial [Pancytospora epiphaga]
DYSRLSVIIQLLAHVEHVVRVSRSNFIPVPNVDSCFMKIEPRVPRPPIDVKEFDNLLKYCFGRKNKTLASNLKSSLLLSKIESNPELNTVSACDVIDKILECIGLSEVRTSKMDVEDFLSLLLEFKKININFN